MLRIIGTVTDSGSELVGQINYEAYQYAQQAKQAVAECEDYYNLVGALETQTQAYATQAAGSAASAATALANLQAANPVTAMGGTDATLSITKMDGTSATITIDKVLHDAAGNEISNYFAPLASPDLTGTPTAPTAAVQTDTEQIATTKFVNAEIIDKIATKTEAETGTDDATIMTPLKVVQSFAVQIATWFTSKIATVEEALAGTLDNKIMTPAKVKNAIDALGLTWVAGATVKLGHTIQPTALPAGCVACCTSVTSGTSGVTGATAPDWTSAALGNTITDGTVVWTIMTNDYVYAEGTGFIYKKHFNATTGAWVNEIHEWGFQKLTGTVWQTFTLPLTMPTALSFVVGSTADSGKVLSTSTYKNASFDATALNPSYFRFNACGY